MNRSFFRTFTLSLSFVTASTVATPVFADEDNQEPVSSSSSSSSSSPSATSSSSASATPTASPLARAGGGIGFTEQGPAVQGHIEGRFDLGGDDLSVAQIEGTIGAPILRVRGRAEAIPIRLYTTEVTQDGRIVLDVTIAPLTADAGFTIPLPGENFRGHFLVTPQIAAQLGIDGGRFSGTVRVRAAPLTGVVGDGDGVAPALGARIGLDTTFSVEVDERNRIDLGLGIEGSFSALSALDHGYGVTGSAMWVHRMNDLGQEFSIGLAARADRLDVLPGIGPNIDSGASRFVGATAAITF